MRHIAVALAFLAALLSSPSVLAAKKTLVSPLQGPLSPELAREFTEQARASATGLAPTLGLLVMTKKTFDKLCTENKLTTPCKDSDCDVDVAQRLGTEIVVSTKVLKLDEKYVVTAKLFDVATGQQLAVKNADAASPADVLSQAPKITESVLRAGLVPVTAAAPASPVARAPAAAPVVDTNTVLFDGPVAFGQDGDLFGKNGELMLYADRLVFQMTGLNFNNKRIEISLSDVSSVDVVNDEVHIAMNYGKGYRVTARNNAEWSAAISKRLQARTR